MKKFFLLLTLSLVTLPSFSQIDPDSKWQIRVRGLLVQPVETAKIGLINGDVNISSAVVPELDITYFFNENWAVELILGTAKHDVKATGTTLGDLDLGNVYLLPPTLTAQYHIPMGNFKPYMGAGVNYTIFYNEDAAGFEGISYENSIGFAAQVGVDYFLNERFFVNLDVKKIFMNTDVEVNAGDGVIVPADVTINPFLFGFGVGMRF